MPKKWRDIAERVASTFVLAFLTEYLAAIPQGSFTLSDFFHNMSFADKAAGAALFAVASLVKGIIAVKLGNKDSASLDPKV